MWSLKKYSAWKATDRKKVPTHATANLASVLSAAPWNRYVTHVLVSVVKPLSMTVPEPRHHAVFCVPVAREDIACSRPDVADVVCAWARTLCAMSVSHTAAIARTPMGDWRELDIDILGLFEKGLRIDATGSCMRKTHLEGLTDCHRTTA